MINTLRITSIVAAILAGIFFVFPVFFGVRSDESLDAFMDSPGVIERFNSAAGAEARRKDSRVSPLVEQAEAYALYLNPPKPRVSDSPKGPSPTAPIREPAVTPRFPVLGTIVHKSRPELSLALIDQPGKGLNWVRQSSKVGHLTIDQIKDGLVVVKGTAGTFDLVVRQKPQRNFLEEGPPVSTGPTAPTGRGPSLPASPPVSSRGGPNVRAAISKPPPPQRSAEEEARLEDLVNRLKDLRRGYESDKTDSGPSDDEKAALTEKLIANFRSSRVTDEEAERLDNLGQEMEETNSEPNRPAPPTNKGRVTSIRRRPRGPAGR